MNFGEILTDVEIMRAGTHTSSAGDKVTFTDEDLAAIAGAYDPQCHEAPVVIGHPAENGPAYGWVKGLKAVGGKLLATLDLFPAFVETVRQGLFKKRSASIYRDMAGKGIYLRHVGFLGAMPPAIKALADISLSDAQEFLTINFSEKTAGELLHDKILEFAEAHGVPYGVAFASVQMKHRELAELYALEIKGDN